MYLQLVKPRTSKNQTGLTYDIKRSELEELPFIMMKTADNKLVPWLASQTDILAEDWELTE